MCTCVCVRACVRLCVHTLSCTQTAINKCKAYMSSEFSAASSPYAAAITCYGMAVGASPEAQRICRSLNERRCKYMYDLYSLVYFNWNILDYTLECSATNVTSRQKPNVFFYDSRDIKLW